MSRLLLALAFIGYIALGLPDALIGVAWPAMRRDFAVPLGALGALYVSSTLGYVLSSAATGALLARIGLGTLLSGSCALTGMALLGYTVSPSWPVLVALGVFVGFGGGAIDAAINTHAAIHYGTRLLNVLHAFYGIGAALGPALMTAVLVRGHDWRYGYGWVIAFELALAIAFALTRREWSAPLAHQAHRQTASWLATLRLPRAQLSLAVFFIYTGCEAAAAAWAFSLLLEARGLTTIAAGTAVSCYWSGLFASRLGYALLPADTRPERVTTICIIVAILAAGLVTLHLNAMLDIVAFTLLGFASGPIFPCMIAMTPARLGPDHTANAVGAQVAAAAVGLACLPALCGLLAQHSGLESIPLFLLGCWLLLLIAYRAFLGSRL